MWRFPLDNPALLPDKRDSRGGGESIGLDLGVVGYVAI
jgi:hypothetical protein